MPVASGYDNSVIYSVHHKDASQRVNPVLQVWNNSAGWHSEQQAVAEDNHGEDEAPQTPQSSERLGLHESRHELIERIKRQQRPHTWSSCNQELPNGRRQSFGEHDVQDNTLPSMPPINPSECSIIHQTSVEAQGSLASGIERPRSALHRGDFRGNSSGPGPEKHFLPATPRSHENAWLGTSPPAPWHSPGAIVARLQNLGSSSSSNQAKATPQNLPQRARAASHSLRSSFIFRPPTSPLANLSNSADIDSLGQYMGRTKGTTPDQSSRRRTYSPSSMSELRQTEPNLRALDSFDDPGHSFSRQGQSPYQAHQPRRSLASFDDNFASRMVLASSAHTRRPSLTSETSPLQRLPMVGRYEESILRGRMSSLPSRPLDFVAQIGVLGKGNCKPSLKCPPHLTIPFPAIFYHYGNLPGALSNDGPSPYVGLIDLDKGAPTTGKLNPTISEQSPKVTRVSTMDGGSTNADGLWLQDSSTSRFTQGRSHNLKHGPRGAYRIPEQGQVQVIVRNPNKTAVKLFLVPYDLKGMTPGQKTFVRQRSYSAGPILDMPLDARRNFGTDRPEAALSSSDDPRDRPVLRYLIHLHICCTARGRYFLYKNIRIVFANRVPDGKEKLRQEIQLPEPRFSAYKLEGSDDIFETFAHRPKPSTSQTRSLTESHGLASAQGRDTTYSPQSIARRDGLQKGSSSSDMGVILKAIPSVRHTSMPPSPCLDVLTDEEALSPQTALIHSETRALSNDLVDSPQLSPALFERLGRDEWTPSGTPPRTSSPQAGQGLIAQQYRSWAKRKCSPEPCSP